VQEPSLRWRGLRSEDWVRWRCSVRAEQAFVPLGGRFGVKALKRNGSPGEEQPGWLSRVLREPREDRGAAERHAGSA
jgi:hypothetical protein